MTQSKEDELSHMKIIHQQCFNVLGNKIKLSVLFKIIFKNIEIKKNC